MSTSPDLQINNPSRRRWLQTYVAGAALSLTGCGGVRITGKPKVVVVGGGYGGTTAAKYLRLLSDYKIDVTLIEPEKQFVSCPLSNLVIGGSKQMIDLTQNYTDLSKNHGVNIVKDSVVGINSDRKSVTLQGGATLPYDKLVVSPGVELLMDSIFGLAQANASGSILQAWKAGIETIDLRRQLEAMVNGGVFAITIPLAPYRCPPGPYERACQAAWYFKNSKPRSKVLIFDANQDVTSKADLFKKVWAEQYPGIVEYRPQHKTIAVDTKTNAIQFEIQEAERASVINALPSMRAGRIAVDTGLSNMADKQWCGVNYQTFESTAAKDVYVLGDSIQIAPLMPKSGHMANSQAKVAAAAIVADLSGWPVNPKPMLTNTCYSYTDDKQAVHVSSVHTYDAVEKTYLPVVGAGGVSPSPSQAEGVYADNWAKTIWSDMLG